MDPVSTRSETAADEVDLAPVVELLGGARLLGGPMEGPLDLHDLLCRGLPVSALECFADRCPMVAQDAALGRVLGKAHTLPTGRGSRRVARLSTHQSSQLWRLAVVVTRAAPIFGGIEAAEHWLVRPALGLDRRRPLDLVETPAGVGLVDDHLVQLEFGVYI